MLPLHTSVQEAGFGHSLTLLASSFLPHGAQRSVLLLLRNVALSCSMSFTQERKKNYTLEATRRCLWEQVVYGSLTDYPQEASYPTACSLLEHRVWNCFCVLYLCSKNWDLPNALSVGFSIVSFHCLGTGRFEKLHSLDMPQNKKKK